MCVCEYEPNENVDKQSLTSIPVAIISDIFFSYSSGINLPLKE